MDIRIGKWGRIISGDEAGWYLKVEDDANSTGGYIIITCKEPGSNIGYDNWVKDLVHLRNYFKASNWSIEWLE